MSFQSLQTEKIQVLFHLFHSDMHVHEKGGKESQADISTGMLMKENVGKKIKAFTEKARQTF